MQKGHSDSVTRWLGMDSMGPPDRQHPSVFASPHGRCCFHFSHSSDQEVGRIPQLPSQRGVENIGGSQSLMNPTSSRTNVGRHILQESQNIVTRPLLVFVNLPNIELSFAPNRPGIFSGNDSPIRHSLASQDLDLQPTRKFGFFGPQGGHFRAGISGNHEADKVLKRNASHKCQPKLINGDF
jgi:hypothetical protein